MFLLLLCISSGMFTSSTSLLPSSFTMYTLTAASAAVLNSDHRRVVLYAMVGVIWGWAVAGVAFLPYAILLLLVGNLIVYLPAGVVGLFGTMTPMVAIDRLFYGKWTVSVALCLHQFALPLFKLAFPQHKAAFHSVSLPFTTISLLSNNLRMLVTSRVLQFSIAAHLRCCQLLTG